MDPRRLRLVTVLAGIASAAVVLGAWTQPWFIIDVGTVLEVRGQDAAPALSGIALAALALVGALMIARPVLRRILGAVLLGLGLLAVATAWPLVISDDAAIDASQPVISAATGLSGSSLVLTLERTVWPTATLVGALLMLITGAVVLLTAGRWPAATSRYDADAAKADTSAGAWDALSDGDDPTSR